MKSREKYTAFNAWDNIYRAHKKSNIKNWFIGIFISLFIILLLPWTQNIQSKGKITTLWQEQRPQEINSPIAGKISKWWVKEGDFVKKGDTILQISEIKAEYLDPNLIGRTQEQIMAKKNSIQFYESKVSATEKQIGALSNAKKFKIEQLRNKWRQIENKLEGERAELLAAQNELSLAKDQYERQEKMFKEGLVSKTQLQLRSVSYQNSLAKKISFENKLNQTQQDFTNAKIEFNSIEQEYAEKMNKAESDKFQSLSIIETSKGDVSKLENQVSSYIIRNGMYILLAPQDGQIVQAKKAGIGEIIKEAENIATIVPNVANYAVEMYVRPVDLPLINIGQKVRFQFDGFPAIVFSGWPNTSYGTFGGEIRAVESNISDNGYFRILVTEDIKDKKWPKELRIGSGAQGIALLNDVPIWYELWRNINGFPPDYYKIVKNEKKK
jgi:multidrug efflux pump subunit AcrA (membrane-fusion protein)